MINMIFEATEKENSKCTYRYVVCACQPHFTLILKKKAENNNNKKKNNANTVITCQWYLVYSFDILDRWVLPSLEGLLRLQHLKQKGKKKTIKYN